jgi:hypothetical protein
MRFIQKISKSCMFEKSLSSTLITSLPKKSRALKLRIFDLLACWVVLMKC